MSDPEDEQSRPESPAPASSDAADDPIASPTPAPANAHPLEWKSKDEYVAERSQSGVSRTARWWGIAFAIFLVTWIIDMFFLRDLTAVGDPTLSKFMQGKPIATFALFGMIVCYFGYVVSIWKVEERKGRSRTLLVLGLIAVANPISAIILLWVTFCGWSGCYGI